MLIFSCAKEDPVTPTTEFKYAYSAAVNEIEADNGKLWVGTRIGLFRTDDGGNSWIDFDASHGLPRGGISAMCLKNNKIWVAGATDSIVDGVTNSIGTGLSYSTDNGGTWYYIPQPLPASDWTLINTVTYDIAIINQTVWIASFGGGLMKSDDMGKNWTVRPPDNNNFDPDGNLNHRVFSLLAVGDTLWVGTALGINVSYDAGQTWQTQFTHQNQDAAISGNFVVALHNQQLGNQQNIWAATVETNNPYEERGVSKSSNGGASWETYLEGVFANNFESSDSVLWVATDYGILFTNDGGANWNQFFDIIDSTKNLVIVSQEYYSVCYDADSTSASAGLWVGCSQGLSRTKNLGDNWTIFEFTANSINVLFRKNEELPALDYSYKLRRDF